MFQPSQHIQVNGLNMYYEEYGNGIPLILLHGGVATSHMWQPFVSTFIPHFRVITPDCRAHGKTNNPAGELSYQLMADDVIAFIQALNLTKPLIFGYSQGGQIALNIGIRYPNLIGPLVIGGVSYKFSQTYHNWLIASGFESPGIVNIERIQRETPQFVDEMKKEHFRADDPDYWQTLLKQVSPMWWKPLDYSEEDFQKITEPTLILLGDRDGIVELQQAVEMYQLIPNAELAIIPNSTHFTAGNELSMNIVLDFLLRHRALTEQQ